MLALMATLAGVLLYERFGFSRIRDVVLTMPDGMPSSRASRWIGRSRGRCAGPGRRGTGAATLP